MPKVKSTQQTHPPAEKQLADLLAKLEPEQQQLLKDARRGLRKRFPTMNELVYDYGKSVVISYAPGERGSDGIVALSADAKGLRLVFTHGKVLADPHKILLGNATQIRFIWLETGKELILPEVEALMVAAEKKAGGPFTGSSKGVLVMKESKKR